MLTLYAFRLEDMDKTTPSVGVRFLKHLLFSLFGTATDSLVLWIFSDYILHGYVGECVISPIISFEFGNIVNFIVSSRFVWGDRIEGEPFRKIFRRFIGFNLSYTTVFFIKTGLLLGIQALTKWDVVVCNIIALTIAGMLNFGMNYLLIFRKKAEPAKMPDPTDAD